VSQRNLLIATGAGFFLVFALALAPARILTGLLPAEAGRISGATGTVWSGGASFVEVGGIQLRDLNWDLKALALLIGRLALTVDAKWGTGFVQGDATIGLTGNLRLRDVRLAGPLEPVMQKLNLPPGGGELAVEIAALDIAAQWPTKIVGTVRVGRVPLKILGVPGSLTGNYQLEFDIDDVPDGGTIPGVLTDNGGPLEILGELNLVPPRDYRIQARISARPDAPTELINGLLLVGPKLPDGSHEFQMTGSL